MDDSYYDTAVDHVQSAAKIPIDLILNDNPLKPDLTRVMEQLFTILSSSLSCKFCDTTLSTNTSLKRHCIGFQDIVYAMIKIKLMFKPNTENLLLTA